MFEQILRFTRDHGCFAVTSHSRPDGDSIGSQLGLALALEQLGKTVHVINADPVPKAYRSLPGVEKIIVTDHLEGSYDSLFVLECNDLKRPEVANLETCHVINIDHHPGARSYGHLNWVDTSASAVGEMVYQLVRALPVDVTPEIATNLYVAILTDTGSFQFPNTRRETFAVSGELVGYGANPGHIAQEVYLSQPLSKVRLLAKVLQTLELDPSGKIAWIVMTDDMIAETGASREETEGIVTHPLSIRGVVLVAFFRQDRGNGFRVSLRSKDHYDVGRVAARLGGGGHKNAAGLSLSGPLPEVRKEVLSRLEQLLDRTK
ncbi:MAG: bifunctional oligoribonuclease/PAP phosphatase NrnA [Acidobacteriota bacterium]